MEKPVIFKCEEIDPDFGNYYISEEYYCPQCDTQLPLGETICPGCSCVINWENYDD